MTKFLIFSLVLVSFISFQTAAQVKNDLISVKFDFRWNEQKLELNKNYSSKQDTLQINLVKFYISNFSIQYDDKSYDNNLKYCHLIDLENEQSTSFSIARKIKKSISKVIFYIGIDSTSSTSGALDGDLDPSNGMYWAWQSGYINMKIEGSSNSCKTRNNKFNFHIGGYLKPNYALRKIEIPTTKSKMPRNEIIITTDLAQLFSKIDLSTTNAIMIPGTAAMELADKSVKMFVIE